MPADDTAANPTRPAARFPSPRHSARMRPAVDPTLPTALYRAAEVRAIDRHAITVRGIAGLELMNRAGAATLAALQEGWPTARTLSAVCGGGNNGGDAYVVARLAHQLGWDVRAYPVVAPDALKGDARRAYESFRAAGGEILNFIPQDFEGAEILVDGLLGTGLDRPVSGDFAAVISAINRYRQRGGAAMRRRRAVVALDIPSGLNADTGTVMGQAVRADLTVSFVGLKRGLFTGDGPDYTGKVCFDDLGTGVVADHAIAPSATLFRPPQPFLPPRNRTGHKGLYGHVLVIGGDHGYSGAAKLAAEAAARTGAGLISIATRSAHAALLNLTRPELMCHGMEEASSLPALLNRASVIAIGPGLGQGRWGETMFEQALASPLPLVVDADALNLLARQPVRRDHWILTPHPGEAARLLEVSTAEVMHDRFAAVAALQARYGGVIVLKGAGTLIQAPTGLPCISRPGNPGMASGGMGDVLTGVIAGLLAQGLRPMDAASSGVWLHGSAGTRAAAEGERGLLASDLMPHLHRLVNR